MARLICSTITSLDGYVADEDGNLDWVVLDDEVHAFVNHLERPVGTERDITVGGPELAAHAFRAGLVDDATRTSTRSWSAAASGRSPSASACGSTCSTSAVSATASFTHYRTTTS
jgi:hypothetical protein